MKDIKFNRILIVRLSALGDVINTLPALAILRKNYPKSFIGWVVEDKVKDIVINHPDIDKVFIFRRKGWKINLANPFKLLRLSKEVPAFINEIKSSGFDVAIDFQGNLKSGAITYLSGAKARVGFERGATKELNHLFINHKIRLVDKRINRVEKNIQLLKSLGLDTESFKVNLAVMPEDEAYFRAFAELYIKPDKPIIVFHPGTSKFGRHKRWPSDNYAALGNLLKEKYNANIFITHGPGETDLAEEISGKMTSSAIIHYRTEPITRFYALLKKASLFIGSDSGPLHLASVAGTPVIALFGPKDPVIYGPHHSKNAIVIRKEIKCSPCKKRTCKKPECMLLITPEEVFDAAKKLL
jgi:lipopolysaccharide heptosyltransferase I